ncbi:LacI family DNA-binding transcriptional regulator [uncultured Devosia sp.]|uniref:LacI family DNA-binding transcriptional regulator n=1 Tax=uncultured Devosia sp. TaxID=211434 RepID=UPI0035CC9E80
MKPVGRPRAATIVDVAQRASVSVGTVSRYLNGIVIRQPKREAIDKAITALRYNRNAAAKAMRTERTNMVALLVPGYDEFFAEVLASLTRSLASEGQVLLTHKHEGDPQTLAMAMEFFQNHRVNAVVTPGVSEVRRQVAALVEHGIPVVFFNNDVPDLAVDRVFARNREFARQGVRHLIDMGHRHIAHIGGDMREMTARERQAGYCEALAEAGIAADPRYIVGGSWNRPDAAIGIERLMQLEVPPTAIFTANYVLAFAVIDYFRTHDITVGRDVSLISFDDVELFRQMSPGITAIAQPSAEMGLAIGEVVMGHVNGAQRTLPRTLMLDCTIILRQSTRPPKASG